MRFRFCGDADCPDWALAEINSLSRLSSIKLKILGQSIADTWTESVPLNVNKIQKILTDAKLDDSDDLKATVACIDFILKSAIKFCCEEAALASELQQLGLPQEHCQVLRRIYKDRSEKLTDILIKSSLRVNLHYQWEYILTGEDVLVNRLNDVKIEESAKVPPGIVPIELTIDGTTKSINLLSSDIPDILTDLHEIKSLISARLKP